MSREKTAVRPAYGKNEKRERLMGYILAAPAVILLVVFTVYPLIYLIYRSLFGGNLIAKDPDFVGIENLAYQAPVEEGVSVFTVNTEKAQKLLPRLPLTLMPVTQQQCLQQGMEYAAAAPKGRDAFWALYREKGFDAVVQKYGKLTLEKKLIYHVIVPVCKKLGIYQLAAKIYLKK